EALTSGAATSTSHLNLGAGSYSFNAQYIAGADPNHNDSAVSSCEPFVIDKATPSSATTLKNAATDAAVANNAHLPLGSGAYDTASITTGDSFALTGTVTFKFFTTIDCTGTAATDSGEALTSGTARSTSHLNLAAGNYSFNAQYIAGTDPNHNDSAVISCEPFVI